MPKFGFLGSEFCGESEFRFGSVGPGRSLELVDRSVLTKMTVQLVIPVSYVKSDFIFGIYAKSWVIQGWSGSVRVFVGRVTGPVRNSGPPDRAGPVRNPEPNRNSVHKHLDRPGPTLYDPTVCVDSESEVGFDVTYRNHELNGHFGQNGPVRPNRTEIRTHHEILTL